MIASTKRSNWGSENVCASARRLARSPSTIRRRSAAGERFWLGSVRRRSTPVRSKLTRSWRLVRSASKLGYPKVRASRTTVARLTPAAAASSRLLMNAAWTWRSLMNAASLAPFGESRRWTAARRAKQSCCPP